MTQALQEPVDTFVDRRSYDIAGRAPHLERRQFTNSHDELSPDAITFEEMLAIVKSLGYHR